MGGASTRNRALVYFAVGLALTLVAIVFALGGRLHWIVIAAVCVGLSAFMLAAILWIDRHGSWTELRR
jgi:hypothetical protein